MALLERLVTEPPLRKGEDGMVRVGTRASPWTTVIGAFQNGAAPEEIRLKYPCLRIPDIYAAIVYYYWNEAEVEEYLARRCAEADELRREIEGRFPREGVRERLLERKIGSETAPGEETPGNLRPYGLAAGEFRVPEDFDAPLPEEALAAFEGQ